MALSEPFLRDDQRKPLIADEPAELYRFGHLIRLAEQELLNLFGQGLLSGTTHTCIGQELCQMSVVRALDHPNDAVFSNHRNHGHFLTYSGQFTALLAEVMGRQDGVCGGRGGSQHLVWRQFHSNGVQGGMTAIGAGAALARQRRGDGSLVAVMVGDGTSGQGLLYESLNLASIWRLPVLFVIENNHIAQTTPTAATVGGDLAARGRAFGLTTWQLTDADDDFIGQVAGVVTHVRQSRQPGLLVIDAERLGPHSKGDDLRPTELIEALAQRDPLARLGARLDVGTRQAIEQSNRQFIAEASAAAAASPAASDKEPARTIFGPVTVTRRATSEPAPNCRTALNRALRGLLEKRPEVLLLGEDLHDPYGGAFKVSAGLSGEFPTRVLSTPISEAALIGCSIGLALNGFRPIAEIMFADFLTLAIDQLYNHAVKFQALDAHAAVPLVVRTPSGGRRGYGPTHSQSTESLACAVPGLTVVFPSQRHDVGALLEASVDWPYPTLFFEHKLLYGARPEAGSYREVAAHPDDSAATVFPTLRMADSDHPDVTLLTYGAMLEEVEAVAARLRNEEELSVEVIVPSLLSPLPRATLWRALAGCKRLAVIEEAHTEYGVGAEILAALLELGFAGRAVRVATPPVPIPAARSLESAVIPDRQRIAARVLELF